MGGCLLVVFVLSTFLLVELEVVVVVGGCLLVIFVLSTFLLVELKVVFTSSSAHTTLAPATGIYLSCMYAASINCDNTVQF